MLVKLKTNKIDFKATGFWAFLIMVFIITMIYAMFRFFIWFIFFWL